ncbi:hypothetical protein ACG7TL_008860 [Trametes sanguinea]
MKIYCFNTIINPLGGVFSVTIDEADTADDVIQAIWEEFRVLLQEQWPKVARPDLKLMRLTEPVLIRPSATLPDRMTRYDDEKKEALELVDVIGELPGISQPGFLSLELRVWPGGRDPGKDAMVVQRNNLSTVEAVRDSPPPSRLASSITEFKKEQEKYVLYNGRPMDHSAAPVTIYHPAFARLRERLRQITKGESLDDRYRNSAAQIGQVFDVACKIYDSERFREDAIMSRLGKILNVTWDLRKDISSRRRVPQADGIARLELDYEVYERWPVYACAELKNELGLNGICEIQVAATYEKAVVQQEYAKIRETTCCPCILVSIAGPFIRFYGAVLVDAFIVQPFTDYIFLGGDPDAEDRIEHVAQILAAVQTALEELKRWYKDVLSGGGEPQGANHILPHPSYARDSDRALLSTLQFLDRFQYPGCRRKRPGKSSVDDFQRSLFRARLNGTEVLVKFCFRYGESAHRLLAEHDPPLAPRLYACAPLVGGAIMVVMAIVPGGNTAWKQYGLGPLPDSVVRDIEGALKVLEQKGLVHGDVRRPNVVTIQRVDGTTGGMLIDFDWSGKHGEVYYPSLLNQDVSWQQGIAPGQPIRSEHDWEMWRALQSGMWVLLVYWEAQIVVSVAGWTRQLAPEQTVLPMAPPRYTAK